MKEKLVEKLFHGTCSAEELNMLFQLIEQDPSPPNPKLMERLWEKVQENKDLGKAVQDRILRNTLAKIKSEENPLNNGVPGSRQRLSPAVKRQKIAAVFTMAASVLLLVLAGIWYWAGHNNKNTVVQTAFGERQTLELSDGSKVELNANSQMTFKQEWPADRSREIWLEGEAFFKVEKKPQTKQKLKVITSDLIVEVLGTTFNVNSKGGKTTVYLEEGKIRLYLNALDSTLMMEPGDLIIYSEKSQEVIRKPREMAELHTSWKNGVLIFKNSSLREVLQKIEDIYGIEINVLEQKDYDRKINFPLPIDELEMTLAILDKTMRGLRIQKEGDIYVVK